MKRKYQLSLLVLCLGLFLAANAFSQAAWTWGISPIGMGGWGFYENSVNGVSIDDNGNNYIVGSFNDSITFGGTKYVGVGNGLEAYIAKLNSTGTVQWVRSMGGPYDQDQGVDIAVDPAGNSYSLGYFHDSVNVGGTMIRESNGHFAWIAKYNTSGTIQWAKPANGVSVASIGGIVYSPEGAVYVGNSVTLGKFSVNGDSIWTVQAATDSGQILINDVTVDHTGDFVYVTGIVVSQASFGGVLLDAGPNGDWDIFVIKLDKNGNGIWGRTAGSDTHNIEDIGHAVEVDQSGNVYVCGQYADTAIFGNDTLVAGDAWWSVFVAKYDSDGDVEWAIGGNASNFAFFAAGKDLKLVSNESAILVLTHYNTSLDFGDSTFSVTAGGDALLLKISSSGVLQWGKQSGSTFPSITVNAMDVSRTTSNVTLVGHHGGSAFLPTTFTPLAPFPAATGGVDDGLIVSGTTDSPTPVKERPGNLLPANFSLAQNYPNPFNPTTTIDYDIPSRSQVTIDVFNVLGQQVRRLVNEVQSAGAYTVDWDGRDASGSRVASGVYLYRIQAGEFTETKKMTMIK